MKYKFILFSPWLHKSPGKGHVAPIGCNKRKAVEYIMQKAGVVASESVALFDDETW